MATNSERILGNNTSPPSYAVYANPGLAEKAVQGVYVNPGLTEQVVQGSVKVLAQAIEFEAKSTPFLFGQARDLRPAPLRSIFSTFNHDELRLEMYQTTREGQNAITRVEYEKILNAANKSSFRFLYTSALSLQTTA